MHLQVKYTQQRVQYDTSHMHHTPNMLILLSIWHSCSKGWDGKVVQCKAGAQTLEDRAFYCQAHGWPKNFIHWYTVIILISLYMSPEVPAPIPLYTYMYVSHCTLNLPFDQEQDLSVHLCSSQDFLCYQPSPKPTGFTWLWNIHFVALVLPYV